MISNTANPAIWNEAGPGAGSDFYTRLLGWQATDVDMGPMGSYTMFRQTSANSGGIVRMRGPDWDGLPPRWSVYIEVGDVDAGARRAVELGGQVCVPPFEIPRVGRACVVLDPEGASFYLFAPQRAA
jgi:predicted enzyme related to lactoylglutathione lyase